MNKNAAALDIKLLQAGSLSAAEPAKATGLNRTNTYNSCLNATWYHSPSPHSR